MDSQIFSEFGLSPEVRQAVEEIGYLEATSIQTQTIPLILAGRDVIGHSRTGSGKTAAFGLPAVDLVDTAANPKTVQILILCPTRELVMQAAAELKKFAAYKPEVKIVSIYGGQQIDRQIDVLRSGCQIVIGTPGRVMDHMRRKTLRFGSVKTVVLDEADEMLNMGFREDIETILRETPEERQTILFSATIPKPILDITKEFQRDPQLVKIEDSELSIASIEQSSYEVPKGRKTAALCMLLDFYLPKVSIVFCNTKKMVDELSGELVSRGYAAKGLHGDMRQAQRTEVMNLFKDGGFGILVATDVAARGIDVSDVDIVFNFDLPCEDEYYIHRIGRTGRAGKTGRSFSLTCGMTQRYRLLEIAKFNKCRVEPKVLPSPEDIKNRNIAELTGKLSRYMSENDCGEYSAVLSELLSEDPSASYEKIACALFAMTLGQTYGADKKYGVSVPKEYAPASERFDRAEHARGSVREHGGRSTFRHEKKTLHDTSREGSFETFGDDEIEEISLSIGRRDNVTKGTVLGVIAGESGLPGKIIGAIHVGQDRTTVEIPKKFTTQIVKSLKKTVIRGKKIGVTTSEE